MVIVYAVCILLQLRRFYGVKSRSCWQEADPRTESAEGAQKSTGQMPAIFFVPSLGGSISKVRLNQFLVDVTGFEPATPCLQRI